MPPQNPPRTKKAVQATESPTVAALRRLAGNAAEFGGGVAKNFSDRAKQAAGLVGEAFYTNFYPDQLAKMGLVPQNTRPTPVTDELRAGLKALGGGLVTSPIQTVVNLAKGEGERLVGAVKSPAAAGEYAASWVSPTALADRGVGAVRKLYIGKNAKNWDAAAEQQAWNMEALGKTPEEIWAATKTFRGPDGEWRQEIDDTKSRLKINQYIAEQRDAALKEQLSTGEAPKKKVPSHEDLSASLVDVFEHPEFLRQYPELMRDAKFVIKPVGEMQGARGWYDPATNTIAISSDIARDVNEAKSVILHELGHGVQSKEKWAQGGMPEQFRQLALQHPKAKHLLNDWSDALFGRTNASVDDVLKKMSGSLSSWDLHQLMRIAVKKYGFKSVEEARSFLMDESFRTTPYGQYKHLAGEAESRSIQKRMNMTPEQRAATIPTASYDVPPGRLTIVR